MKLGVFRPVTVYPFYEAASSAHWGQTPREAMAESGTLWSRYSEAAAQNPNAWLKRRYAPEEITTPTADNRLIAWPYNKLMPAIATSRNATTLMILARMEILASISGLFALARRRVRKWSSTKRCGADIQQQGD